MGTNNLYIESPAEYVGNERSLFLAGGITGCPDWQFDIRRLLRDSGLVLLNPRRQNFPIGNPSAAEAQIRWEYEHLRAATGILFWFPKETLCPIVLYELGAWTVSDKPIFVGVHPEYQRKQDVYIQTRLVRPKLQIVTSIESLASQVSSWLKYE